MAEWKYSCKTIKGMDLDLKLASRAGLSLKLTKARSGAGKTSPTQLMRLLDLLEPVQELQIQDAVERLGENVIRLPVILKNKGVMEKYNMHQLGVYAEDPDEGEILYIVLQSESAEEIPSSEEMKDFTLEWYLNLSVGNAQDVTVMIDETCLLTTEQADARYVAKEEGDASGTIVEFIQSSERKNISSGEKLSVIFGKIKKYFADLKTVAFTGSYNDLTDKPSIPAEVRVKGNSESRYRTGDVNITPENIGAPSNKYISDNFVPGYISTFRSAVANQGWYRIAEANQYGYSSCVISLKRSYNSPGPEYQKIQLMSAYTLQKFVVLAAYSHTHFWTKIREVWDSNNSKAYIEIYQNRNTASNAWQITIEDAISGGSPDWKWKAIEAEATEEAVSGVNVLTSLDLPANFDSDYLARKDGSNVSGTWNNLIAGKALSDGDGNMIKDNYLARKRIESGTFDNLTEPGLYQISGLLGGRPTNTISKCALLVMPSTRQVVFECEGYGIYTRNFYGGTWNAWKQIYVEGNISSLTIKKELVDLIYPIGSIYMTVNSTSPATLFGGTWVRWGDGRVPVGIDTSQTEFNAAEKTGGSKKLQSHKHTTADTNYGFTTYKSGGSIARLGVQIASSGTKMSFTANMNTKDIDYSKETASAGEGNSENLQPYITCYMWKRTA